MMHAEGPYPTEGWVTCPVRGCDCYSTWSVDEKSRKALEQHRAEHFHRHGSGKKSEATREVRMPRHE
jgi:hypothetical protein